MSDIERVLAEALHVGSRQRQEDIVCMCDDHAASILAALEASGHTIVRKGLREYRFTTWDDTPLVITVDDEDPGDMGEPRTLVDYDSGPTTYVSVRTALETASEKTGK